MCPPTKGLSSLHWSQLPEHLPTTVQSSRCPMLAQSQYLLVLVSQADSVQRVIHQRRDLGSTEIHSHPCVG